MCENTREDFTDMYSFICGQIIAFHSVSSVGNEISIDADTGPGGFGLYAKLEGSVNRDFNPA